MYLNKIGHGVKREITNADIAQRILYATLR